MMSAGVDTGDVNESVYIDISLQNSGDVGGLQFDIFDTPNYLDVTGFSTTDRSDGFTVDFNELESGLTRSKNTVNILFKNISIVAIGILTYFLCGFKWRCNKLQLQC